MYQPLKCVAVRVASWICSYHVPSCKVIKDTESLRRPPCITLRTIIGNRVGPLTNTFWLAYKLNASYMWGRLQTDLSSNSHFLLYFELCGMKNIIGVDFAVCTSGFEIDELFFRKYEKRCSKQIMQFTKFPSSKYMHEP